MTIKPTASRIAIPVGDPNGIGPEISLKTVASYSGRDDVVLTLFGPEQVLEFTAEALGLRELLARTHVESTMPVSQGGFSPGKINAQAGAAASITAANRFAGRDRPVNER